ncbi:MAG: ACP S-malonyltransferase [Gammaproteobacteria bacterium]|nr:ACP S-malonyltransferase [Gammaproteobacteria bacterium]
MSFAMMFPGQGSQSVGMLQELAEASDIVGATFGEASDVLGYDVWQLACEGPAEEQGRTAKTQPLILTASVAVWRLWCARSDARPAVVAGHSLGEYSALVCAGALDFSEAVQLVATRGALMQQAVPQGSGAMAAVLGLDDDAVIAVCTDNSGDGTVEAVNFNSPGQVVIAGDRHAVERACTAAKEAGARRAQMLPVSVPAHSSLMRPAAEEFASVLAGTTLTQPQIEVLHNVGVDQVSDIRDALTRQLYHPVPWTQIVRTLAVRDIRLLLECGPGRVLTGLARRVDKSLQGLSLHTPEAMTSAIELVTSSTQSGDHP